MSRLDRYQNPEVYERLAAAYVVGSLKGHARRRFRQLAHQRSYLQQAIDDWERRLSPLAERLPEVQPPQRVWQEIQTAIGPRENIRSVTDKTPQGFWRSLALWRGSAFAGMALAAALLVYQLVPLSQQDGVATAAFVAVLESQSSEPMVMATAYQPTRELKLVVMDEGVTPRNQRVALWCVMETGRKYMPMGELQHAKETTFKLSKKEWRMLKKTKGLAISMEPMDAPPPETPTGPVMYEGNIISFI